MFRLKQTNQTAILQLYKTSTQLRISKNYFKVKDGNAYEHTIVCIQFALILFIMSFFAVIFKYFSTIDANFRIKGYKLSKVKNFDIS